jgi:alkylation response protein AidB-like acyl-CoA dehydrogenase
VATLFTLQGAAATTSSALHKVLAHGLGAEPGGGIVLLPGLSSTEPPATPVDDGGQFLPDGEVPVRGLLLGGADLGDAGDSILVCAQSDGGVVVVPADPGALILREVAGMDPWLSLVEVSGTVCPGDASGAEPVAWTEGVALAQLALAHELIGALRRMLELAREHALERVQFGQPISQFQAIRHRLAETFVAIEAADAVVDGAWLDGRAQSAAMAKAAAGRAARTAARHCQQVLAGIGFTTEHDLHRYVRRVFVLDELLGSTRALTRRLGEDVAATGALPPLLPL